MLKRISGLLLGVFIAAAPVASATPPPAFLEDGEATTLLSWQYRIKPAGMANELVIRVIAPTKPLAEGETAAVVFLLDGAWYTGMASDILRMLIEANQAQPAYVVSIGYSETEFGKVLAMREPDLLHKAFAGPNGQQRGGNGAALERFIADELKPFIAARHPVDMQRAYLAGQSFGGLFATTVLLNRPESFAGYLIGSPSIWANPDLIAQAQTFSAGGGRPVFLGVGGVETERMREGAASLAAALSRPEAGLALTFERQEGETHSSMQAEWLNDGFKSLLKPAPKSAAQ
jgi:predicted alpha/beta superfamily hydrolase